MNKPRPRIRPVGALAAVTARKQASTEQNTSTLTSSSSSSSEQGHHTLAATGMEPNPPSASNTHLTESQIHRPTTTTAAATTTNMSGASIVRRTAPSVIRPGAASTLRPSTTTNTQQTDSFALEFHRIDGNMPHSSHLPLTNVPHTASTESGATQFHHAFVATNTTTTTAEGSGLLVPYQHLGLLDPSWNIPPPNPQEKTLKDFCSKFKVPRQKKQAEATPAATATGATDGPWRNNNNTRRNGTSSNNNTNTRDPTTENPPQSNTTNPGADSTPAQRSGPLVEVINGEIVIQESSLILGARRPTTQEVDRELENVVVEESTGITATYNSFTKRQKTQHWSAMDTKRFFIALRQCGTDFTTMETLFNANHGGEEEEEEEEIQYRTRKQLKSKYLIECRNHPHLIDMAMNPSVQIPVDLSAFGELEIGTVVPPLTLPAPIPTLPATITTPTTTMAIPDTTTQPSAPLEEEEKEGSNNEEKNTSHEPSIRQGQEDGESLNHRNESEEFFQDEFTTAPHLGALPPVIKPSSSSTITSHKNRPNFRAALKGKRNLSTSTVTTTK